jgi:hypothetical protein
VIGSVQDFIDEGRELNHCIYTNKYFCRKDSLILSATIDNKRIETIEFSLKEMKIVQARIAEQGIQVQQRNQIIGKG